MCRKQDGTCFAFYNLPENVEQFLTGDRVQTGSRFIQNQQLGVVGQCQSKQIFYLHSI